MHIDSNSHGDPGCPPQRPPMQLSGSQAASGQRAAVRQAHVSRCCPALPERFKLLPLTFDECVRCNKQKQQQHQQHQLQEEEVPITGPRRDRTVGPAAPIHSQDYSCCVKQPLVHGTLLLVPLHPLLEQLLLQREPGSLTVAVLIALDN